MTPHEVSLSELRRRLAELSESAAENAPAELERFCAGLAEDTRVGARKLAEMALRKREKEARERARLAALFERRDRLRDAGLKLIAGVDEVGVGPLAGPVVAAAVVLPDGCWLPGLNDSKKLSRKARERLDIEIRAVALGIGIGSVEPGEIDRVNIFQASLEAMRRAVVGLPSEPQHVLVDARTIPGIPFPQSAIPNGDAEDASIAAASIVAKVHRDQIMRDLDASHPGYGFAQHKGYGTADHLEALGRRGPTVVHRRSFAPVASLLSR